MRLAFPTELFDGAHWERLLARAAEVPAAAAADVFGFEIHLGRAEPAADFCIVVPAGSAIASHYLDLADSDPDPVIGAESAPRFDADSGALAACLREIARAGAFANRAVADRTTMLEYDVMELRPGCRPPPAVFWDLAAPVESSQVGELARLLALASGFRRDPNYRGSAAATLRETEIAKGLLRVAETARPYGRLSQVGAFVGRKRRSVRVIVSRLEQDAVAHFLNALGWPGRVSVVMDVIVSCALPGQYLALALDVGSGGVGARLGLELSWPGGWTRSRWRQWQPFTDTLVAKGWCREDKGRGLESWCGLTRLFGRRMHLLAKGVNHIKIGVREDVVEAKAYLGAVRRAAADLE